MRVGAGCRRGPPAGRTCQTDLDAGAVPARPGVRHLPPTIGQPRIQRCRPPARPGPAPPPPPQGYGSGLGAGVRAGTRTPRPRRPGGWRMVEPGDRLSTRRPRPSLAPSRAQSGAAAATATTTTSEPDASRPRRFRRRHRLPEPRALPPSCRPGPARARVVQPPRLRACARPRGCLGGARRAAASPAQPRALGVRSRWPGSRHPSDREAGGGDRVLGPSASEARGTRRGVQSRGAGSERRAHT